MKTLAQTVILSSALFAATAFASGDGLNPSIYSTESNMVAASSMVAPSSMMADQNYRFTGIYENAISSSSTERQMNQGYVATPHVADFCLITDLSIASSENSVESHLGGRQC